MLTCVDARVDPLMLTRAEPGDILVHRNVGSVVPQHEVGDGSLGAAVEFALRALQIPNIVVMGHSHCGAMKAALNAKTPYGPLSRWLDHTEPARRRFAEGERPLGEYNDEDILSQVNVLQSLEHLAEYAVVREKLDDMAVTLHGWWFDLPTATVSAYDPRTQRFEPVERVYSAAAEETPI
jgi:carbonic anhydrase